MIEAKRLRLGNASELDVVSFYSIMREPRRLGMEAARKAIFRECGVSRSIRSIENRTSRIHVSLAVQQACPEYGVVSLRLYRQSSPRPRRPELMHLNKEIAFNEILEQERETAIEGTRLLASGGSAT